MLWRATREQLTKPNNRFKAILNFGGSAGSHLHLFGVHVTSSTHFLTKAFSHMPGFSSSLHPVEADSISRRGFESGVFPGSDIFSSAMLQGRDLLTSEEEAEEEKKRKKSKGMKFFIRTFCVE
jgi:hypothetical protein